MPLTRPLSLAALVIAFCLSSASQAQSDDRRGSTLVSDVGACRNIADPRQRLKCFDAAAANLHDAHEAKELVILDKSAIKETRRGRFGFRLPSLKILDPDGNGGEEIVELEGTIKSLERDSLGMYRFVLEHGGVWQQTDGRVRPGAKAGSPVVIRQAALGGFIMKINNQPAVRVKRIG